MDTNNFKRMKFHDDVLDYSMAKRQIDAMAPLAFGSSIDVLLVTDRLFGCMKGLSEYLQNSSDITVEFVDLVCAYDYVIKLIEEKPFDFLIIVGHLEVVSRYEIVQLFQRNNEYSSVAFFALPTSLIWSLCRKYDIEDVYDRSYSPHYNAHDELIASMKRSYARQQYRKGRLAGAGSTCSQQQGQSTGFMATLRRFFRYVNHLKV